MRRLAFADCLLLILLICIQNSTQVKKQTSITQVEDLKDFKKLMKTKTNVLVLYINIQKEATPILKTFREVADKMKGQATLVSINCAGGEGKKLCKKLKIEKSSPYFIKHFKDGEFNKDYDRAETVNSIVNFLLDPTGDAPWDEDPSANHIYHLADSMALSSFLKKCAATSMKSIIMFYAPWCGYCKILKPEYSDAALDLKGEAMLAAMDVSKPHNSKLRYEYNITGFPTLLYFVKGNYRMVYNGENKRDSLVRFIRDPNSVQEMKKETPKSWDLDTDLLHLTADSFDSTLKHVNNAMVVFYAPWCGHCKNLKPNLIKAEESMRTQQIAGMIAVVDVTSEQGLGSRFNIKGYPSIKYFNNGEYKYDLNFRTDDKIVEFMKNPQEPVPTPPETPWSEEETSVRHLSASNFKRSLKKAAYAIVMFYAPWCGHCKSTKPEFVKAADTFADNLMVLFGAVDCTVEEDICNNYKVTGYPTFKYFHHYEGVEDYNGGRRSEDFVKHIHTQIDGQRQEQGRKSHTVTGFGINVVQASDADFEEILSDSVPSFVMYHAQWCGHCNEIKPSFSRLATKLKSENAKIKIVAIDVTDNPKATDFGGIKTLPTLKMYAKSSEVSVYGGDRSEDDMYKFCKSFQVKDEL
ncbi:protein disulfide-isomerase A5 [Pieris rapae]|uniref:protein disulfide-isomerase A5 n=1 Tax=Pieris rapae TaxID=64459 RepID=UPI001E27E0D4|nr:protein disulfide-isomerase A5 [Pieris rapae]